jgi:hypothetical protein
MVDLNGLEDRFIIKEDLMGGGERMEKQDETEKEAEVEVY